MKAVVDKIVATPSLQLSAVFPPFAWNFGKVRVPQLSHPPPTLRSLTSRVYISPARLIVLFQNVFFFLHAPPLEHRRSNNRRRRSLLFSFVRRTTDPQHARALTCTADEPTMTG